MQTGYNPFELHLDLNNYDLTQSVFKRVAARGIIRANNNYLMIYSKYGDYKFPGGGLNQGETGEDALFREVQEETGYRVKIASVQYAGIVHEIGRAHV